MAQFFTQEEFHKFFGDLKFDKIELISTDTYSEDEIAKSITKVGKDICLAISIQLAIIGYGNKKFNYVRLDGKDINIEDWFKNNKINYTYKLGDKLKPGELTPRRMIRFFRYATEAYLKIYPNLQSYIFKKYAIEKTEFTRSFIFPGFEHIATINKDEDKVRILIKTYVNLDKRCKTQITERIIRVLSARGFPYSFLTSLL